MESRKLGRFHAVAFALCFLILFVDGLDYSAANVGAPAILRAFNAERAAMGTIVFGWGYFGIFIGSVSLRHCRQTATAGSSAPCWACFAYSLLLALLTPLASSLDQVTMFRFLAGIGIGGVVPNTIALLTETGAQAFPRQRGDGRLRRIFALGNATIGQVAAWFIPTFGWSIVFLVAGAAGTILFRRAFCWRCRSRSLSCGHENLTRRVFCARWSHARGTRARAPA